ncbi:MAG TPA: hypothetical protein PK079_12610 [Leptospiraceae bacterium]|nr:hypothetical protein [Leptospiraceae bacterium]HMW06916.1 hypothetical protein [Leptospiraceae bacterium]HMX32278.1 hypothetical protein [Leptospiraceae bacterium]HMY33446.1 hypothetical protein [Leptospiraceae bacterium]HMZ65480.1 hypothetical protein [Leptospiraceae bacterium]
MNPNENQFLKCKSCSGHITILDASCPYCGEIIVVDRILSDETKKRISWIAIVLESKIWKKKFILFEKTLFKWGISILLLELILFAVFSILSKSNWKPIVSLLPVSISICAAYYLELYYFYVEEAERSAYKKFIEPIIDEFLIGNNYYKVEFEAILDSIQDNSVSFLKRMISPTINPIQEQDSLSRIVIYHSLLIDKNQYRNSTFQCGYTYIILSFIFGILSFLILLSINWSVWISVIIPFFWVFLLLEYTDKTSFVFNFFGYKPQKNFIEKEVKPSIQKYCEQTGVSLEEIITKSKDLKKSLHYYL